MRNNDCGGLLADLRQRIHDAAPAIVEQLILKAKEGSHQHAKFLFEVAGLTSKEAAPGEPEGRSIMRELLEKFEREIRN